MWKKDGELFYGSIVLDGMRIFNPTNEQLVAAGYSEETEPIEELIDIPMEPPVIKYSQLKIIRALGQEGWEIKKAELVSAGLFDEFIAADYLASDDPVFASILATLSEEEKALLTTCERDPE